MKLKKIIIIAMLFGNCIPVYAATISNILYGGNNRTEAACYLYNSSSSAVTILSKQLISQAGDSIVLDATSNCGATIAAGHTCVISANIAGISGATICKFVISQAAASVRGGFDIRDSFQNVLNSTNLR
jgi:hypothetical protein